MGYLGLFGQTPFELQNQSTNFDNATLHQFPLLLRLCDFVFYRSLMTVRSFWRQFRFVLSALDDTICRIWEIYASNHCALFNFISYPLDLGDLGRTTDSVNLYSQIRSMHECCRSLRWRSPHARRSRFTHGNFTKLDTWLILVHVEFHDLV